MLLLYTIQQTGGISINGNTIFWSSEDQQQGQINTIDTMLLGLQSSQSLRQKLKQQKYSNYSISQATKNVLYNDHRLEQCLSNDLQKLKINNNITQVVVAVPSSFTNSQRTAVVDALNLSQIKLLSIMNQPAASILSQTNNKMNKKLLASIHYDPNEYLLQTCIAELDGNKVKVISVNHLKVDDFIQQNQFIKNQFKNYKNSLNQILCVGKSAQKIAFMGHLHCQIIDEDQTSQGALYQAQQLYKQQQKQQKQNKQKQDVEKSKIKDEWIQKHKEQTIKINQNQQNSDNQISIYSEQSEEQPVIGNQIR